ncbi:MAG TPA: isomerizing glutamine--fructose-6-phosphate transaminase [Candidatus Angelobacter sp.]|jgi:glucosamine--fructose-6-phosphate aminotransferase (isomerizing)|nr:isomerizing glutamine--fructose-6-phosphate transaminase [Candidatus Angelobacter sp.]
MSQSQSKTKNGFPHFMLKEIFEQPQAVQRVIEGWMDAAGKITVPGFSFPAEEIRAFSKVTIAASGSSRHAGMVGEFMLERMTGLVVEVDFASQYCYRDPVVAEHELTIFLSQSGTTIDTLTALQAARDKGARTLAICNVPETPLTQNADSTLLTHAGEEIAIAATKSFTTQLTALFLLSAYIARTRGVVDASVELAIEQLKNLSAYIKKALSTDDRCQVFARQLYKYKDFIYVGRDIDYPIALEGALKLKEVSYIHAEGYPTGELKHGPTALVNEDLPVVVLATRDKSDEGSMVRYERTVSNIREFVQREIPVVAITTEGDTTISQFTSGVIPVPELPMLLQPIVEVIPLQFLAYHIAVLCGRNVDRPRHLSKSVMIE